MAITVYRAAKTAQSSYGIHSNLHALQFFRDTGEMLLMLIALETRSILYRGNNLIEMTRKINQKLLSPVHYRIALC
jgi:hypothetical protein